MAWIPVHLACAALVATDMAARALRIRLLVSRLGGRLSIRDALRLNLLGDAAAEITPFRIAGEPSRVYGLLQCGAPSEAAVLAVGAELVLSYGLLALLVAVASWATLPVWWSSIGPALAGAAARVPLWAFALLAAAIVLCVRFMPRFPASRLPRLAGARSSLRTLAGIRPPQLAAVFGLGAVNMAARLGILWMLVSALPGAPGAATVLVGSFVLVFGQSLSPTPSGLGVVELGMLGGAAGQLGQHGLAVLLYWRVYTTILPIALAAIFAVPKFGVQPVIAMLGLRRTTTALVLDAVEPGAQVQPIADV